MPQSTWSTATSADWLTAADWTGPIPNANSADALINAAGTYLVSIAVGETIAVQSITVDSPGAGIEIDGALTLAGSLALNTGTLSLNGLVQGGTLLPAGGQLLFGAAATLDGVTFRGALDSPRSATINIRNGLTVTSASGAAPGTINLAPDLSLNFTDSETLTNLTVLANGRTSSRLTEAANNGTLVLDTSVAVLQTAGTLSLSAPGAFGQIINRGLIDLEGIGATFITGTLVNAGTITLPNNGLFQSFGSFINTGTIALAGGADLNLFGDFSNTGTVSISTGSTLDLHQLPASLGAVTVAAGGTVILHGNVALANLPAVSGQGQLSIAGTLDLGGGTLVPGAAGLPPNIAIGTVRNGTLVVDGSLNQLTVTALDGITIAGTLRQPTGSITVINGLTASNGAATIDLRSGGSNPFDNFIFADTEALNNVTVLLESPIFTFGESSAGNTLTLGPNTALVQTGQAGALTGQTDQIGANGTLRNLGAINLASAGFTHLTGQAFINAGSVMVGPAAQLVIDAGTFVNSGTITIAAGGAFDLATFAFLADLGSITNAGTLLIDATGTLDLNGATLDLSATPNFVVNGTLQNGTLVTQASNYTQGPNATLTNVTVLACFAEGTKILTTTGERSVETLRIGDLVPTFTTRTIRRIAWIGDFLHPTPPIRIRAHAFAPNTPHTDLRLSPDHAVYRNGALIPVHLLANPMTIHAETIATKTRYIHLQLDQHDTILANGLATESYLDTTHRAAWDNRACAPLLLGGEAVKALRKPSSKNFRTLPWSSLRLYS